jgi:hypothetical protein
MGRRPQVRTKYALADRRRSELLPALGLVPLVLALLVVQAIELQRFARQQVGIYLIEPEGTTGTVVISEVVPGLPGEAAGLRVDDIVRSVGGMPIRDNDDFEPVMLRYRTGDALTYEVERDGRQLSIDVRPGARFPLFPFAIAVVTVLCWFVIGPLALVKRPGYLRARLLFLLAASVSIEIALPAIRSTTSPLIVVSLLLNGFQMAVELHLASVIPEKQSWIRRWPWVIPGYYVFGLGVTGLLSIVLMAERFGASLVPWESGQVYITTLNVLFTIWAVGVLALLARQAFTYPEPKGRQQAALVALGILPWAILQLLSQAGIYERLVPGHWSDVFWNSALLLFPLAVFIILVREAASQEQILLSLTDEVQHVASVNEISRIVSTDLHEAFHPKSTHVFYRQRHSRDLTLGHSTGVALKEEQIPEQSVLLRLVEAYGKAVDYPEDLAGLPPDEQAWLDRLAARLIVPLNGRDHRLLGLLVLGEKKSEEPYTPHDRKLLQALTNQIALVYENARLKDRVEQSQKVQREVLARLGEQELQLVRECPTCGRCYDASDEVCADDRSELAPSLPVERVIMGRYRLDRKLERGGMGAIYEARDMHLGRQVAVKVLHGALIGEEVARRFETEARLTAALRHPNVITVFDYGTTGTGNPYLVMELLTGFTLGAAIQREVALPPAQVADWMDQVCEGVRAAHRSGIIHRDLKPANVFVTTEGGKPATVKILDFGVAKVRGAALEAAAGLTAPGTLVGTFSYMAPEQLSGAEVDERADIFALAVLTVESLTGHRPYPGTDPGEILTAIAAEDFHLAGDAPGRAHLEDVLRRALARDPAARYPSVEALQADLIPALRAYGTPAPAGTAADPG